MKTRALFTIPIILTLGALSATAATQEVAGSTSKPAMGKMEMSHDHMMMAGEPHHVLAMAYHQNLAAFAKALYEQAASAGPLNLDFARTAVSEMRRSFDQMKQHHQEHMAGMSAEMHAKMDTRMSGMMEKMQTHQADMNTQLTALEQEVNSASPDAKKISAFADSVHAHLTEMATMHEGCQGIQG
jgi:polyhydroxyalkanoate synthesis regulator phasin